MSFLSFAVYAIDSTSYDLWFEQLKDIVHENLNVFVGACVDPPNICLVWHYCPKGSLQVTAIDIYCHFFSSIITSILFSWYRSQFMFCIILIINCCMSIQVK